MTTSINQPWAISDKIRNRYGNTWADIDFTFEPKISAERFMEDPLNVTMGSLHLANSTISMKYKDLLSISKSIGTQCTSIYAEGAPLTETFVVSIKGREFQLNKLEIRKVL
jgi:hypothetical protein